MLDLKPPHQLRLQVIRGSLLYLIIALFAINYVGAATNDATCYLPDGTNANTVGQGDYSRCNSNNQTASMCCDISHGDVCTDIGLCKYNGNFYRDTCTDQTWQSPGCIKLCEWNATATPIMLQCYDGSFCCGPTNTSCCSAGEGVVLQATSLLFSATTSAATTSTSQTGSSTTTTSQSTTSTPSSGGHSSNKVNGLAVGLGAGLGGAALLICIIATVWFCLKRRHNQTAVPAEMGHSMGGAQPGELQPGYMGPEFKQDEPIPELPGSAYMGHIIGGRPINELPSGGPKPPN